MNFIKRLISMLLDHIIMTFLIMLIFIPIYIIDFFIKRYFGPNNFTLYPEIFLMAFIYFNKDFLRAKSLGKRIMGFQVINLRTKETASGLKCFIRNLTIVLFPIEIIILLFTNGRRRLGDFISGTKVIKSEKEPIESLFSELKIYSNRIFRRVKSK